MFVLSGTGEQRFPGLGSLKLYYSCYQLFLLSFFTVKLHSYTVEYTFLNFFYPVEFNRAKKPTLEGSAWTGRLSLSSLSLFSFSELNKAIDANEYNWWRVFVFLPQELQTRSDLSSARNILFARTKSNESPRLLWGLKHVLGANLIPLRTKLVTQTKRVPAWPVINQLCFPERHFSANGISLRLSEVQMKFYERLLQALLSSATRGFAARSRVLARLASLAQIGELQSMHNLYLLNRNSKISRNSFYRFLWNFAQQKTFIQRIGSVKHFKRKSPTGLKLKALCRHCYVTFIPIAPKIIPQWSLV